MRKSDFICFNQCLKASSQFAAELRDAVGHGVPRASIIALRAMRTVRLFTMSHIITTVSMQYLVYAHARPVERSNEISACEQRMPHI